MDLWRRGRNITSPTPRSFRIFAPGGSINSRVVKREVKPFGPPAFSTATIPTRNSRRCWTRPPDGTGGDLWERKYVLLGLDAYYEHFNADPAVLRFLVRQTVCLISPIGELPKVPISKSGWSLNNIESRTLIVPVVDLFGKMQDPRFLEFLRCIIREGGCDGYDLINGTIRRVPLHEMAGGIYLTACDMMSFFIGVINLYTATGDERCRASAVALFESLCRNEITLLGRSNQTHDLLRSHRCRAGRRSKVQLHESAQRRKIRSERVGSLGLSSGTHHLLRSERAHGTGDGTADRRELHERGHRDQSLRPNDG